MSPTDEIDPRSGVEAGNAPGRFHRSAAGIALLLGMAALGAAQTLAFVHLGAWPLPWLAMAALVLAIDGAAPRRAFGLGWAYGTGWLTAGTAWLFISMHRYGGLPAWMAALAVFALAAALSLYLGAACAIWAAGRPASTLRAALRFAAVWLLAEWARAVWFTGFPWVSAGYSQVDAPVAALAPWVGVYGIGALMAGGAVLLARAVRSSPWAPAQPRRGAAIGLSGLATSLVVLAFVGGGQWTQAAGRLSMSLLQTGVSQDLKFDLLHLPQMLQELRAKIDEAPGRVVVAPETAIPLLPEQVQALAPEWWAALQRDFAAGGAKALMTGVPLGDFDVGFTNSVAAWGGAAPYRYDKHHLVPFGEFIPPGFRWFTQMMNIPLGDFARGPVTAPSFDIAGQRLGPNICYEDLFGEELARRYAPGGDAPTILVNISNLAWFGDSWALPQHLAISRMRSLELQRPMVRATNTGMTAYVDHTGRVVAQLPPLAPGRLDVMVEGRSGTTPYAAWIGRTGWWLPVGLALLVLLVQHLQSAPLRARGAS